MLMIVDGNNIAYRAFHTPQGALSTKQGEPTGVMLGFLNSLRTYLEKFPETTRVIVTWDGGKAKWRKELYPAYKANRSYGDDPEEKAKFDGLFAQIDTLNEFLPSLGVHSIKLKGWEADDLIHCICQSFCLVQTKVEDSVLIITSDKDMLQLISDTVSVYTPYKGIVIGVSNFYEETGVTKEAYIGYRCLVGDTSDNIIGVDGIGEKTAKSLMDTYGHIDNILGAKGDVKTKLLKSKRTAKIFDDQGLMNLAINNKIMNFKYVPYDTDVEDAVNCALGIYFGADETRPSPLYYDSPAVKAFCTRWQFVSILSSYMSWINPFTMLGDD